MFNTIGYSFAHTEVFKKWCVRTADYCLFTAILYSVAQQILLLFPCLYFFLKTMFNFKKFSFR